MMVEKTLEYYMALPYPIELIADEDGFWLASIPTLKGCITQGSSRIEALEMIDDAKRAWLKTALDRGIEIPKPGRYCES